MTSLPLLTDQFLPLQISGGGRSLSVVLNLEPALLSLSVVLNFTWHSCRSGRASDLTETCRTHTFTTITIFQKDCFDLNHLVLMLWMCHFLAYIVLNLPMCYRSVAVLHLWVGQKWESLKRNRIKQHHRSGCLPLSGTQQLNLHKLGVTKWSKSRFWMFLAVSLQKKKNKKPWNCKTCLGITSRGSIQVERNTCVFVFVHLWSHFIHFTNIF